MRDGASGARRGADGANPRSFLRCARASVVVEGALSVSGLVVAIAVLMGVVHTLYSSDRLARAARAGAHDVALLAAAPADAAALEKSICDAGRRELGLEVGPEIDCADWAITVRAYPNAAALLASAVEGTPGLARGEDAPPGGENGDFVLVRIGLRDPPLWSFVPLISEANAHDDAPVSVAGVAVARNERASK